MVSEIEAGMQRTTAIGQGLVEYLLILALVSIASAITLSAFGAAVIPLIQSPMGSF